MKANYIVSFTGAGKRKQHHPTNEKQGASVTAGIGTYRGTEGIDTKEKLGQGQNESESDVDYEKLQPTLTHKSSLI
jgi:hypothetical protein